jgi:hypothetical protein
MCQVVSAEFRAEISVSFLLPDNFWYQKLHQKLYLRHHFIDWSFRGLMATTDHLSQFSAAKPFEYVSDETSFRWTGRRRPLSHEDVMTVKRSEEKDHL